MLISCVRVFRWRRLPINRKLKILQLRSSTTCTYIMCTCTCSCTQREQAGCVYLRCSPCLESPAYSYKWNLCRYLYTLSCVDTCYFHSCSFLEPRWISDVYCVMIINIRTVIENFHPTNTWILWNEQFILHNKHTYIPFLQMNFIFLLALHGQPNQVLSSWIRPHASPLSGSTSSSCQFWYSDALAPSTHVQRARQAWHSSSGVLRRQPHALTVFCRPIQWSRSSQLVALAVEVDNVLSRLPWCNHTVSITY